MSVICSECGRENDLPCNFCPGCGSKVVLGVSTNQDDKSEAPRVRFNDGEKPKSVGADLLAFPESQVREKLYTPNPKDQRDGNSRIRVVVRKRPLNSKEVQEDVIVVHSYNYMTLHEPKQRVDTTKYVEKHQYMFDEVFNEEDNNREVYTRCAKPLLDTVCAGGHATCFAYGQTGSGKTHTMMGHAKEEGLYLLACRDLLNRIQGKATVHVSFFEIYVGKLFDLLNDKQQVHAREDGDQKVHIRGLQEKQVTNVDELMAVMEAGLAQRSMGETGANAQSSRSHAILHIILREADRFAGKFTFIDLAGNERGADTKDSDSKTRMEGAEINKSLLALKECIRALDIGKSHIPFRGSKLTEVLKDSFMGNSRTVMIAAIGPSSGASEHTLNTLRYADRVKDLKPPPKEDDSNSRALQLQTGGSGRKLSSFQQQNGSVAGAEVLQDGREARSQTPSEGNKPRSMSAPTRTSVAEKMVRCPLCKEEMEKWQLDEHKPSCPDVILQCEHCGANVKRKHMETHSKSCPRAPTQCTACGQTLPKSNMTRHLNNDCPAGTTYCLFCKKKMLRSELEAHKAVCEEVRINCEHCNAAVKRSKLPAHLKTCNKLPVPCPHCGVSVLREKLPKHVQTECRAMAPTPARQPSTRDLPALTEDRPASACEPVGAVPVLPPAALAQRPSTEPPAAGGTPRAGSAQKPPETGRRLSDALDAMPASSAVRRASVSLEPAPVHPSADASASPPPHRPPSPPPPPPVVPPAAPATATPPPAPNAEAAASAAKGTHSDPSPPPHGGPAAVGHGRGSLAHVKPSPPGAHSGPAPPPAGRAGRLSTPGGGHSCPFQVAGCTSSFPEDEQLQNHLNTSVQDHLMQTLQALIVVQKENQLLRQSFQASQREHEQQIASLTASVVMLENTVQVLENNNVLMQHSRQLGPLGVNTPNATPPASLRAGEAAGDSVPSSPITICNAYPPRPTSDLLGRRRDISPPAPAISGSTPDGSERCGSTGTNDGSSSRLQPPLAPLKDSSRTSSPRLPPTAAGYSANNWQPRR